MSDYAPLGGALAILLFVILFGTVGFSAIEGWDLFESFYMVLITITTIGYLEVHELSRNGRILNSLVILGGVATFTYSVTALVRVFVQRELLVFFRHRAMEKKVQKMSDHQIVCGAGRLGLRVAQHLQAADVSFVVIEIDEHVTGHLLDLEIPYVEGDATDEEILHRAGITRAKGLVTATSSDATNVYVSLTARDLNPDLYIVARANSTAVEPRLFRAGANRVINPDRIGSRQMADALLRPAVTDFLDDVMKSTELNVNMESVTIRKGCELEGKTLGEAQIRKRLGVQVLVVRPSDGPTVHKPDADTILNAGDRIVVVGDSEALKRLEALCR